MTDKQRQIMKRLAEIASRDDGRLTAEAVVRDAAAADSPLHTEFEWDDTVAAHRYRLDQARAIIRVRLQVEVEERVLMAPFYVRDPAASKEQGYLSIARVRREAETAREVVLAELSRIVASLERARAVATAIGMAESFERLFRQIAAVQDEVEQEKRTSTMPLSNEPVGVGASG